MDWIVAVTVPLIFAIVTLLAFYAFGGNFTTPPRRSWIRIWRAVKNRYRSSQPY